MPELELLYKLELTSSFLSVCLIFKVWNDLLLKK